MRAAADLLVARDKRSKLLEQCVDELVRNGAVRVVEGVVHAR
jgi:hypothetical protein